MSNPAYVLGHATEEIARLQRQARLLEPATRGFLAEAGLVAGMRVLDVGSGAGDVAFVAADIVGASGEVIGVDTAVAAVAAATRFAQEREIRNVSFRDGDPAAMTFDRPFDAAIGRYVLLFQAASADMVRRVSRHVRPGGLVLFHEPDWVSARSIPPAPTYDRCCGWIRTTFRNAGTDSDMAGKLYAAFVDAGLPAPSMRLQTFIGGGTACVEFLQAVADLVGILIPAIERLGIATRSEVDVNTLAERLIQEIEASASVVVGRSEVAAWSRV